MKASIMLAATALAAVASLPVPAAATTTIEGPAATATTLVLQQAGGQATGARAVGARAFRARASGERASVLRRPNVLGRVPILEYHLVGAGETRWKRDAGRFRQDLELLYRRGYRPITVSQLVEGRIDVPRGLSPVVFTFDDSSPEQFRYIVRGDSLVVDPTSAVGIWLDFHREHPDWPDRATFCLLPAAAAGHAFFGDDGIEGQKTAWRFRKLRFLVEHGFELCNHTLWHADLAKYSDAVVEEQLARADMAIDSAVPGYRVRTMALPYGVFPRNRALARSGSWLDPHTGRTVHYRFDAILEVSGPPVPSPRSPAFDPYRLTRIQVSDDALERVLDELDRTGERYVSNGDSTRVAPRSRISGHAASRVRRGSSQAPRPRE